MAIGINLFDILIGLVFCKILIDGYKGSFCNEIFLLLSSFVATVFAAHYYERFGNVLGKMLHMLGEEFFCAFALISIFLLAVYPSTREGWRILINTSVKIDVNPWILTLLAAVRAYFISIMILICLMLTNNDFLVGMVRSSFSKLFLRGAAGSVYQSFYDGVIQTVAPTEPLNRHLFKTLEQVDSSDVVDFSKK